MKVRLENPHDQIRGRAVARLNQLNVQPRRRSDIRDEPGDAAAIPSFVRNPNPDGRRPFLQATVEGVIGPTRIEAADGFFMPRALRRIWEFMRASADETGPREDIENLARHEIVSTRELVCAVACFVSVAKGARQSEECAGQPKRAQPPR